MKKSSIAAFAVIGIAAALTALHAAAAEDARYGSPVGHLPYDREVRLGPDTKSVTVRLREIVRFVNADGREFFWRFDSERPGVFPLSQIAPSGVAVPASTTVYVLPEIPLSP